MFKPLPFLVVLLVIPGLARSQTVSVKVLSTDSVGPDGTIDSYVAGPFGVGSPNCTTTPDGAMTHCMSHSVANAVSSLGMASFTLVEIKVLMPDRSTVRATCNDLLPRWSICIVPKLGTYRAKVGKHTIMLRYETQGEPEYNSDGTLQKATKLKEKWAKFWFEKN
jgi:hypothetical protein